MSEEIEEYLHRLADARRQMDNYPSGKGATSEMVIRQFYADTLRRLTDLLIAEGYGNDRG